MHPLKSKIGIGTTSHTRFTEVKRKFSYDLNYLLIDLAEDQQLNEIPLFKWNSNFFFSIHDSNYLTPGTQPLAEKLTAFMLRNAPHIAYTRACLLTSPMVFGINFNPVSFFFLEDSEDNICAIIAEVHNTFKQKHLYLLENPTKKGPYTAFDQVKGFHVSPFFNVEGSYYFLFRKKNAMIDIIIDYNKGTTHMFNAQLNLELIPITKKGFVPMAINFTKTAFSTFPRILFQAAKLSVFHRLPFNKKGGLNSNRSFSKKTPSFIAKVSMAIVNHYLKRMKVGHLEIKCPNGETLDYGKKDQHPSATIIVDNYALFTELLFKSDIGLADSFIKQYWRTDHLNQVLDVFIANLTHLRSHTVFSRLWSIFGRMKHQFRNNSISNAKKNIYEHYDLGNEFFNLFLDQHKVYSSAIFNTPADKLEDAQIEKINRALALADVKPHHRLLEIGSGWGALAIHAAKTIGCHVTTITISEEQYKFVKQEINRLHLDAKIEVKLIDYRLLTGKYDRIISIEMLEAVGHSYLSTYFNKCHDLLHRKGKAMFQCIMIPDHRYDAYRKSIDFIQKHIFPGGHLPSPAALKTAISSSKFEWIANNDITTHYVQTLNMWEKNFISAESEIKKLGFDDSFIQTWVYYFNYCSAAFKTNYITNHQFLIQKCAS